MTNILEQFHRAAKRACRLWSSRISGREFCWACGFRGKYSEDHVLWPELIDEWALDATWAAWFDQREGHKCVRCSSNLRSGQLAAAIAQAVCSLTGVPSAMCLRTLLDDSRVHHLHVAEINSAGSLHPFLSRGPNLRYSEFGSKTSAIASEDLMNLSYPDEKFDLVITSETLEHVPDADVALGEIWRVLKPFGFHVFTVPVVWDRPVTRQRASVRGNELAHLAPPSYHGSRADQSYFVFSEFGADFVQRCGQAGFEVNVIRDDKNPALATFVTRKT